MIKMILWKGFLIVSSGWVIFTFFGRRDRISSELIEKSKVYAADEKLHLKFVELNTPGDLEMRMLYSGYFRSNPYDEAKVVDLLPSIHKTIDLDKGEYSTLICNNLDGEINEVYHLIGARSGDTPLYFDDEYVNNSVQYLRALGGYISALVDDSVHNICPQYSLKFTRLVDNID